MYVCVYKICVHYYRLVLRHQLALQANSHIDLWLHYHQQNKEKNSQWWVEDLVSFAAESVQKYNYIEILEAVALATTDELYLLIHCI